MDRDEVLAWLREHGTEKERAGMLRYGIPNDHAVGVSVGELKQFAKQVGTSHELAQQLWETGVYEARTLAAFIDEPAEVTEAQMDVWTADFDNWAICDSVCFHLFDRTAHAWDKAPQWIGASEEFVRRAGFATYWGLSVHDNEAPDERFEAAIAAIELAEPDPRPLVRKAADMALRAIGKRNAALNRTAVAAAERMAASDDKDRAWIGRHAGQELTSAKVQERLGP
jgi:3-methyladenine DNA glycosylase AlkD